MKNYIVGAILGLLIALGAIYGYRIINCGNVKPIIPSPFEIKTIIGISGTVMEGATPKPNIDVKVMDASSTASATPLITKKSGSPGGTFTISGLSVEKSAVLTYADIGKAHMIGYIEFAPLNGTIPYAEKFDFADVPLAGTNRLDVTLNGAASAYALKLNAINGSTPESQTNTWVAKGSAVSFVDPTRASHYTLQIYSILPDGKLSSSYIAKDFWTKPLTKDAIMYITVNGLP